MDKILALEKIRGKLKSNKPSIGSWIQIPNSSFSEIFGDSGYDWLAVDMEHGSIDNSQLPDIFRSIELGNTLPLVRVANPNMKDIKLALDSGAGGIIAPMVESSDHLKNIISYSSWPPNGIRGVGFSRSNLYGKNFDTNNLLYKKPLVIAQIENINAVNKIEDILKVNGLDAIILGPYDLSASMGINGDFKNDKYIKAINKVLNACKKLNVPSGIHVINPDQNELKKRINEGYRFIAYSTDAIMFNKAVLKPNLK